MFFIDFKPQFLNYPLDPQQYARVTLRAKEIATQLSKLQQEIASLQQQPEYVPLDEDSRDRYAQYIQRLRDRISILKQQQHECQQVVSLHLAIDGQARGQRRERSQIKNRMLEQYKMAIMAKRSKKIMEKMKEVEIQRRMLEEIQGKESTKTSQIIPTQKIELNPQKRNIFGRFQQPTLNLLRFRNSQTQQRPLKRMNQSRKSSLNKNIKLPLLPKSTSNPQNEAGFLVMSSPMKFSNYSIQNHQLKQYNPSMQL